MGGKLIYQHIMISSTGVLLGLICVIICMVKMTSSQSATDVISLRKHLFENSSYDRSVRPAQKQTNLTEVEGKYVSYSVLVFRKIS